MLWDSVTLIIQLQRPWLGEVREDSLIGRIPHPPPSYPHTMVGVRCHPYYRRGRMGPYHPPISQLPSRLAAPCLAWNLWSVIRALPLLHFDPLWSTMIRPTQEFPIPHLPQGVLLTSSHPYNSFHPESRNQAFPNSYLQCITKHLLVSISTFFPWLIFWSCSTLNLVEVWEKPDNG